ncbi:A33 antigen Glycoprotein [Triplophysa tibetana]|uniref:A33 antigen Glycoprotein n=1 Tax=Triplophysa tibetana TaxID=1572043 RepID=A0A5A9PNT2_9TELE|nr:A33 antigen Glycoprotein [Triplophysa tibetana]
MNDQCVGQIWAGDYAATEPEKSMLWPTREYVSSIITVDIPQKEYKVARGDNATIPCKFTPQPSDMSLMVKWTAHALVQGNPEIPIASYLNPNTKPPTISTRYKGKATLKLDIPQGLANLQLIGVINTDTRTYECNVEIIGDEDGSQSDTANLVVLVAPSMPVCKIAGVAEYGQNINITCHSEEGTPTPAYKWQSHDVNNVPRPNPPKTTDQNGILSLYNISKDTSGYFICTSTNEIRSAKCNITLAVMLPSMNMASTFGILGGVAAAVIILGIIIFCCCCRKKNKPEEYEMGEPEGGEFTDTDPKARADSPIEPVKYEEEPRVQNADRRDPPDDRSVKSNDRRSDYDDRRDQYSDRRDDRSDRRERYDRDDRYDDRRDRYEDRSDRYDDRRDRNGDRYDRRDDRDDRRDQYDSDRYSDRYDSRDRPPSVPPSIPSNKPRDQRN